MKIKVVSVTEWDVSDTELEKLKEAIIEKIEEDELEVFPEKLTDELIQETISEYMSEQSPDLWGGMDGIDVDSYFGTIHFCPGEDRHDLIQSIIEKIEEQ